MDAVIGVLYDPEFLNSDTYNMKKSAGFMCAFTFILSEVMYGTICFANPKKRVWPLPMSISLSISWNIRVLGWWIVAMMTLPSEASDLRMRMILSELLLSKPEVGSSSTKQLGSASNYTPMATRFRCPPEMLLEN